MSEPSIWARLTPQWWLGWLGRLIGRDAGLLERFRWGFWVANLALFLCLVAPTLQVGHAGWPLRLAAAMGLIGACVWEVVALRAGRFPLWADLLETATVVLLAWRYPPQTGRPLIVFVLTFALAALGFRVLYSTPWQAGARTVTVLAAIYAGQLISLPGHDAETVAQRMGPLLLPVAFVVLACWAVVRRPGMVALGQHVAARLDAALVDANTPAAAHTALLNAVLELFEGRADIRVIIWDEDGGVRPIAAAGSRAAEALNPDNRPAAFPPWMLEPMVTRESIYRESVDHPYEEVRQAIGFLPVGSASLLVPLHREKLRFLTVGGSKPIPSLVRREIETLAKMVELALGSMEVTDLLNATREALRRSSNYDSLTHLANRELLHQRLEWSLQLARTDRQVGLLLLDVDHFKTINDSLGHLAGDQALVAVAERLSAIAGPGSTVARLGGDEFAILLDRLDDTAELEHVARGVLEVLDPPLSGLLGRDTDVSIRASIGLALSGQDARNPEDLLRNADIAMYAAKTAGGNAYRVFEPNMAASLLDRLELESDLNRALERDELVLHYQPAINLQRGDVLGVEALVRWQHPQRGLLPPARFIPIAEENGLINQIGLWVLRQGCAQLRSWSQAHPELDQLVLGVNLSPRQLAQPDLARSIGRIIAEAGVDPHRISLELTESGLIEGTQTNLDKLQTLKALGVRLAIDDFGTGFSSLSYLRRFPFDTIKIDSSFVHGVVDDDDAAALASAIIRMGEALDLRSIGEGVETPAQAAWFRKANCDAAQGHLFAPALAPDQLLDALVTGAPWLSKLTSP